MKGTVSSAMSAGARRAHLLVACLVLSSLAAPASAGDGNPATSDVADPPFAIPYEGFVMRNNAPYDSLGGTVPLTFRLHPAPECGGCGADCCALWEETQDVVVHAGRFSVALGSTVPLDDVLLDAELTYLSITVDGVQLSGFQAIEPAAYAIWAANAADFRVSGRLRTDEIAPDSGQNVSVLNDLMIRQDGDSWAIRPVSMPGGVRFELTDEDTSRFVRLNGTGAVVETMLTLTSTGVSVAETLTVGQAATLGSTLYVTGLATLASGLTVGGATTLNSTLTVGGAANLNNALTVGGATTLNGTATVAGATTLNSTLRVAGAVSIGGTASQPKNLIDATQPLFIVRYVSIGTQTTISVGRSTRDWVCWLGGIDFPGGNIDEHDTTGSIIKAYTYENEGEWHVRVDFRSHGTTETHRFILVCAQKGLVDAGPAGAPHDWTPD